MGAESSHFQSEISSEDLELQRQIEEETTNTTTQASDEVALLGLLLGGCDNHSASIRNAFQEFLSSTNSTNNTTTTTTASSVVPIQTQEERDFINAPLSTLADVGDDEEENKPQPVVGARSITTNTTSSHSINEESIASTSLTTESWSLRSTGDGSWTISATTSGTTTTSSSSSTGAGRSRNSRNRNTNTKSRIIDVYQTDSTLIREELEEDWTPLLLPGNHQQPQRRLQLPFRPCTRKICYCKNNRKINHRNKIRTESKCSTMPLPTSETTAEHPPQQDPKRTAHLQRPTNAQRFLQESSTTALLHGKRPHPKPYETNSNNKNNNSSRSLHRRHLSDELQGLWIPFPAQLVKDTTTTTSTTTSIESGSASTGTANNELPLRWVIKSHSERNLLVCAKDAGSFVPCSSLPSVVEQGDRMLSTRTFRANKIRAVSEDLALQQQPRLSPPALQSCPWRKKQVDPAADVDAATIIAHPFPMTLSNSSSSSSASTSMISRNPFPPATPLLENASSTASAPREDGATTFSESPVYGQPKRADSQHCGIKTNNDSYKMSIAGYNTTAATATNTNPLVKNASRSYRRLRSRSEDIIDLHPSRCQAKYTSKTIKQEASQTTNRQRARSEDVVDLLLRSSGNHALPTELVVKPPLYTDDGSLWSTNRPPSRRSRTHCRDMVTRPTDDLEESIDPSTTTSIKKLTPPSPTSVVDLTAANINDAAMTMAHETEAAMKLSMQQPKIPSLSTSEIQYRMQLQEHRYQIDQLRRCHRRCPQEMDPTMASRQVIELYHQISCLHFQHARYDAALRVVDHALERLYLTQENNVNKNGSNELYGCMTLAKFLVCAEESVKPLLADLLTTKARILLADPTTTSSSSYSLMAEESELVYPNGENVDTCILKANYFARTAVLLLQPMMNQQSSSSPEILLIVAKGLSILGLTYSRVGLSQPGVAMGHFQESLNMFRFLYQHQHHGQEDYTSAIIGMAETLSRLGNLHLEEGMVDLAKEPYWEALRLYRFVYQQQVINSSTTSGVVVEDMATTLTNLGWIHLLEHDLALAHRSTSEALCLLQYFHGLDGSSTCLTTTHSTTTRSIRNLASVEYQLGMIASRGGQPTQALAFWKAALRHQQVAFRVDHVDIAITMEAIGSSYHQLYRWSKARAFLEGAIEVRKRSGHSTNNPSGNSTTDMARIESRLALVLLEMNLVDPARRVLSKASKRYRLESIPLDDLGCQAKRWLSQIRRGDDDRLND